MPQSQPIAIAIDHPSHDKSCLAATVAGTIYCTKTKSEIRFLRGLSPEAHTTIAALLKLAPEIRAVDMIARMKKM